jgi:AcrR family transcriptional regulator
MAEEKELSKENMPSSLASAVITLLLHKLGYSTVSTSAIAKACDVSEGTLVKCLRRIEQSKELVDQILSK